MAEVTDVYAGLGARSGHVPASRRDCFARACIGQNASPSKAGQRLYGFEILSRGTSPAKLEPLAPLNRPTGLFPRTSPAKLGPLARVNHPLAAFDRTGILTQYSSSVKSRRQAGGSCHHIHFWCLSKSVSLRSPGSLFPGSPAPGPRLLPHPIWDPYPDCLVFATLQKCRHAISPCNKGKWLLIGL